MTIRRRRRQRMKHNGYHPHLWEYPVEVLRKVVDSITSFAVFSFFRYAWSAVFAVLGWIIRAIINIFR